MIGSKGSPRVLKREIRGKTVFILLLVCLALLLAPMLYIAQYDVPCADDFSYGLLTHRAYSDGGSAARVLSAAFEKTALTYKTWQGTFSAVFLMSLQPAIFGQEHYALTPYIMLAALLGGIFFFCYTVFGKIFGGDKYSCGIIALTVSILCTQFVPTPSEAFYWYNGAIYYTFYLGISLICYSLILRYVLNEKRRVGMAAGIVLLLIFMGGGNYVTALMTAELLVLAAVFLGVKKNSRWKDVSVFFTIFMAAFLVSALAPGNAVRQANQTENLGVISAILACFKTAAADSLKWTTLPVAALMIFLIPISGAVCLRTEYRFGYPLAVTVLSFCLLASMYCPPLYAMGYLPWRITDIIFFAYILFAALNIFYWTGWFLRRYEKLKREPRGIKVWFVLVILLAFAGGTTLLVRQQNVTSAYAAMAIYNGGAKNYCETAQKRLEILNDESIKNVELEPFEYTPSVLFVSDVTEDADDWRNDVTEEYFGKESITLTAPFEDYWE